LPLFSRQERDEIMKEKEQNKMAIAPMNKLILKMGLPMIISMVLQAL